MKKQFIALCVSLTLSFVTLSVFAQEKAPRTYRASKWAPERGYWVVESNIHTPKHSVITFYNDKGAMLYKELVDGVRLNLKKRKTLMRLKRVLDQSVTAWEGNHPVKENESLVAAAFGKN